MIRRGRVSIDGAPVTELGTKAFPDSCVEIDGIPVKFGNGDIPETRFVYILLNKPDGIISSADDQFGRKTVVDLIGVETGIRIYPVGRLDYHTAGLILLTNDGDYAYRVTHPKFGVEKAYDVVCDAPLGERAIERLRNRVVLEDGFRTSPARVRADVADPRRLTIILREGKNRQIRRMIEAVGGSALSLTRIAIGGLKLGSLAQGEWRALSRDEADLVFQPYRDF